MSALFSNQQLISSRPGRPIIHSTCQQENESTDMDGSALRDALALVALGPQRSANAVEWFRMSMEMCKHCQGTENVNEAVARIITQRLYKLSTALELIESTYVDSEDIYEAWRAMGETAKQILHEHNTIQ